MKLLTLILITVASSIPAMDLIQIRQFISGSVINSNAVSLGFDSVSQTKEIVFGKPLSIDDVNQDSLKTYPQTGFSNTTKIKYLPVYVKDSIRCFAILDSTGKAVSVGYTKLAQELSRTASNHGIALESIQLYRSTQINSYLISIPTNSREKNLIVLEPNWDSMSRSTYPEESETIERIRRGGGSK